jgi:hypothetical protein
MDKNAPKYKVFLNINPTSVNRNFFIWTLISTYFKSTNSLSTSSITFMKKVSPNSLWIKTQPF